MDPHGISHSIRHLQNLRNFIRSLVEQTEKTEWCECNRPPSFLLVGPPGVGKTFLVKQMSTVCEVPLYGVHTHHLNGVFDMRTLFNRAREIDYPSLLFLDDLDVLFANQDVPHTESPLVQGLRTELFAQLGPRKLRIFDPELNKNPVQHNILIPEKGAQKRVGSPNQARNGPVEVEEESIFPDNSGLIVVAATSAPWHLYKDHELLSRFRGVYLVGLPDKESRYEILKSLMQKIQHNLSDKDFWVLAEKTEGYTPSDLMILIKSLNYKQFEFLFNLARAHGSVGTTDEEGSILSSAEITETDTESEEQDDVVPRKLNTKILTAMQERPVMTPVQGLPSPLKSSSSRNSPARQDIRTKGDVEPHAGSGHPKARNLNNKFVNNMAMLAADWTSDAETSKMNMSDVSARNTYPGADSKHLETGSDKDLFDPRSTHQELDTSSPDSALGRSKSSEEDIESSGKKLSTSMDDPITPTTEASEGSSPNWHRDPSPPRVVTPDVNSFVCDNSLSAISPNVSQLDASAKMKDRSVEEVEVVMETREVREPSNCSDTDTSSVDTIIKNSPKKGNEPSKLNKCDDVREFKLKIQEPPDPMQNDNQAIDSDRDSDSELSLRTTPRNNRRVNFSAMSPMEPLTIDIDNLSDTRDLYPSRSPVPPESSDEIDRATTNNNILRSLLSRSASVSYRGNGSHDIDRRRKEESRDFELGSQGNTDIGLGEESNERRRSCPDLDRSIYNDDDDTSGLKALLGLSLSPKKKPSTPENMEPLNHTPTSITPPASRCSSTQSVGSFGSGARVIAASSESDTAKKQDSDSSFGRASTSHTNASSDMSTVTCNETGDTLECHSDSEERFQNLSEDSSEQQHASSASEDEAAVRKKTFYGNLNLDNLGEISIQVLTLADILEVVENTPRTISEEEIEKYNEFMAWFGKVAKSSCPHTKTAKGANASNMDDISLASTMSCATSTRKRKKPLKKVGRFLLKALMFILD